MLTTKFEYQHPHKTGKSYDELDFISEMTGRSISMTKRMVVHPATMEYYLQGQPNGITPTVKMSVVKDLKALTYNFSGESGKVDSWDGAILSNPFFTYLLKNSLPAKGASDVQKPIGTFGGDGHSVFVKCALFTLTNEVIRNNMEADVSPLTMMKSMNNIDITDIDFSKIKSNNGNINLRQLVPEGLFYNKNGETHEIFSLSKQKSGKYILTTQDSKGNTNRVSDIEIKNLYQLWEVLGGAYSKSLVGNKLIYSDASIKAIGGIISLVPELKNRMIGIVAQQSAVKNGATNVNNFSTLKDGSNLMYSEFDTHFLGVQLDANHTSDESVVNEVSQVLSALAQKQSTPELYLELYSAVSQIIEDEIDNYNKKFKNSDNTFNKEKITKDFIEVLKNKDQLGNGLEIIDLLNKKLGIQTIPMSNQNFYQGFVINVISKLKTDFIRRKYPGLGAVLNPSYGMIQIYEDIEGNTYFHSDLVEKIEERHLVGLHENATLHEEKIFGVQNVINELFPTVKLSPEEYSKIKPLDFIRVTNPLAKVEKDKVQNHELKNIDDYYFLKSYLAQNPDVLVEKVYNKSRDLKPVDISFTQNGADLNIFDLDSLRLKFAYKSYLEGNEISDEDIKIIQNFIDYRIKFEGLKTFDISDKSKKFFVESRLELWTKRAFELIDIKQNYAKVTSQTDFLMLFGEDTFLSKFDLEIERQTELITNYNHKPAEIIMPKINRTQFKLGNDSFNKINSEKEGYFYNKLSGNINPDTTDVDLFVASHNGDNTYIKVMSEDEVKDGEYERKNIVTKEINGVL